MANIFKLKTKASIGTSEIPIYTVPTSGVDATVLIGLLISNISATEDGISATIKIYPASGDTVHVIKAIPLPLGSSLEIMAGNKIVLEAGDVIKGTSSEGSSLDAALSILEMSS